jgi:16S rRNA (cytidine1402-2'-O)-methyltransferase
MGTLYLVATPIGNLEDLSPRAVRILKEVRLIAAEDTRVTRKLLTHFGVHTPLTSYYEHNKLTKLDTILSSLAEGDVALVSDAGTPALNDPGYELVQAALETGHAVSPIPGPSAPLAALVASGLPTDAVLFLGYLPRKSSERRALLERVASHPYTLIFLEAPHRLEEALADLEGVLGDRKIAVGRELTKVHEELWRGSLREAQEHFQKEKPRGEFTLIVAGQTKESAARWSEELMISALLAGTREGSSASRLSGQLAAESGWTRREIYKLATLLKGKTQ